MASHKPSVGFLLVAGPDLTDENFRQTVVLMVGHDAEGSFGLVLNQPLEQRLLDVLPDVDPRAADVPLLSGGPVQRDMVQFVTMRGDVGRAVVPGVRVGASLEDLLEGDVEAEEIQAYVGYAGWGAGQLEEEIEQGSWVVAPARADHVFEIPAGRLWATVLRELGGEYAWMALKGGRPVDN